MDITLEGFNVIDDIAKAMATQTNLEAGKVCPTTIIRHARNNGRTHLTNRRLRHVCGARQARRGGWGESGEGSAHRITFHPIRTSFSLTLSSNISSAFPHLTYNLHQAEAWLREGPCEKEIGLDGIRFNRSSKADDVLRLIYNRTSKFDSQKQLGTEATDK